jgi:co-chaperonin GroES (HSP10)
MKLFGSKIAVIPIIETTTSGGIALPQGTKSRRVETLRGTVITQSEGYYTENGGYVDMPDLVGEIVHYFSGAIFEVVVKDVTYHVIDLTTLLCVEDET